MNIRSATRQYESWLAKHLQLIPADLRAKHKAMAEGVFPFLRATFYRWAQIWRQECPDLAAAPEVLGIGDLHVENFGTWRDKEGRLIWGVNDFDEAAPMPYTNDLARLAASARLAIRANHLSCDPDAACDAMLEGYTEAMKGGGSPFVLAERHHWLMGLAQGKLRDPVRFWERLNRLPTKQAPLQVKRFLTKELPEPGLPFRVVHRRAGLGSLGRPRFTLLAEWRGGMIVREAKALAVSAWHGLEDGKS